jgi:hypothetical protein
MVRTEISFFLGMMGLEASHFMWPGGAVNDFEKLSIFGDKDTTNLFSTSCNCV